MAYLIKTYTFSTPIDATNNLPFQGQANISFATAKEEIIYLDDTNSRFDQGAFTQVLGQRLLKDTNLGGVTLAEGTALTFSINRVGAIVDQTTGEGYLVFFPQTATGSSSGMVEIGDRTTVMIVPRIPTVPEFDPSHVYDFIGPQRPSSIQMAETSIPPSYLSSICFAAGTMIETANGPRPVETLRAGDLIVTRDRGLRPLGWIGQRHLSARLLDLSPNLRPIRLKKDALAPGIPASDLTVSPQHRILVSSQIVKRLTGVTDALVAAKHLCGMPGIAVAPAPDGIDYFHLLFDRHELVFSNGCWTESLFTGPQAMISVGPAARREIRALFPDLFTDPDITRETARLSMKGRDARELTRRHLKNAKPLIC